MISRPSIHALLLLLASFGAGCVLIVGDYDVGSGAAGGGGGAAGGDGGGEVGGAAAACNAEPPSSYELDRGYGQKNGFVKGDAIAVDSDGDSVFAGTALMSELAFGNDELAAQIPGGVGGVFVASVRPDGNAELVRGFATSGDPVWISIGSVAVDDQSSGGRAIYMSGQYEESLELGAFTLQSAGYTDAFVTKLDGSGEPLWARSFGGAEFDQTPRIAIDAAGDVLVAMRGNGTFPLGGSCTTPADTSAGLWTFKLRASDGECVWVVKHQAGFTNNSIGFAYDPARDVAYLGAETLGDPYFSSVPGRYEAFVYAFRGADGSPVWPTATRFGPIANEMAGSARWVEQLRVSPCGDLYALGQFEKSVAIGSIASFENQFFDVGADSQLFLVRLAPDDGSPVWAARFPHQGTQLGQGLATGPGGLLAITGEAFDISGSPGFDFGGGPMPQNGDNPIVTDAFVAVFVDDGASPRFLFAQRLTDHGQNDGSQRASDALFDASGRLRATGTFDGSIQFSRQVGDSVDGFSYGAFVVEYGPP